MARLYILIKRKGSNRFLGAIPSKTGVSKLRLKKVLRKELKGGFTAVIVTLPQLKRAILKQRPVKIKRFKRRAFKRIRRSKRKK